MPAAIAIPLIISAAGTAATVGAQVYASKKAAKQQEEAGDKALGLQREVLNRQQQNAQPGIGSGNAALNRLNSMLGGGQPSGMGSGQPGEEATIIVTAPDGQQAQRPSSERQHWLAKGAQVQDLKFGSARPPMPGQGAALSAFNQQLGGR